jgi:hypothetical protein
VGVKTILFGLIVVAIGCITVAFGVGVGRRLFTITISTILIFKIYLKTQIIINNTNTINTYKSNVQIRFMAMQSAFKIGIDKGFTNGINDVSSSESRYRREIENECKIIYSSK